jgi:carbon-monoxide dehydrogenase small subunit
MAPHRITLRVNGKGYTGEAEARKTLADFIREDCGLTGTHLGCEHGVCGACTILMNGEAVRSCLIFAVQAEGADLMTVEGLADGDRLHPIQQAYWDHHALQCGFCTPGFLMTTVALLRDNPRPTEREIREGLAGNLCRCTGYQNIVTAVAAAADALASGAVSPATASREAVLRTPVPASGPPAQAARDVDGHPRPPAGGSGARRRKKALTMKKASKRKRKPSR